MIMARSSNDVEESHGFWRGAGQLLGASIKYSPILADNRFIYVIKPAVPLNHHERAGDLMHDRYPITYIHIDLGAYTGVIGFFLSLVPPRQRRIDISVDRALDRISSKSEAASVA